MLKEVKLFLKFKFKSHLSETLDLGIGIEFGTLEDSGREVKKNSLLVQ